jgi:hypothetical protein
MAVQSLGTGFDSRAYCRLPSKSVELFRPRHGDCCGDIRDNQADWAEMGSVKAFAVFHTRHI